MLKSKVKAGANAAKSAGEQLKEKIAPKTSDSPPATTSAPPSGSSSPQPANTSATTPTPQAPPRPAPTQRQEPGDGEQDTDEKPVRKTKKASKGAARAEPAEPENKELTMPTKEESLPNSDVPVPPEVLAQINEAQALADEMKSKPSGTIDYTNPSTMDQIKDILLMLQELIEIMEDPQGYMMKLIAKEFVAHVKEKLKKKAEAKAAMKKAKEEAQERVEIEKRQKAEEAKHAMESGKSAGGGLSKLGSGLSAKNAKDLTSNVPKSAPSTEGVKNLSPTDMSERVIVVLPPVEPDLLVDNFSDKMFVVLGHIGEGLLIAESWVWANRKFISYIACLLIQTLVCPIPTFILEPLLSGVLSGLHFIAMSARPKVESKKVEAPKKPH